MQLVSNELKKIFNKKNTHVILFIIVLFVFFTNYIYKYKITSDDNYLENAYNIISNSSDKRTYLLNKYIIDNKVDINKLNDVRGIFINFFNEYEFIIIIFLLVIIGNIMSSEYISGTIKQLLLYPFNRKKIFVSKLLASLVMLIFIFCFVFSLQIIFGGILFGFDSLKVPVVLYDYNINGLVVINIFKYLIINLLNKLPLFIINIIIIILLNILIPSSSLSSLIVIINYSLITPILNSFNVKYYVNMNWDLTQYLYGNSGIISYNVSLIISILYFTLFLIISVILFDKKDIKNI